MPNAYQSIKLQCFNCWKQCWERSLWDNKIQWEILNAYEYVWTREKYYNNYVRKIGYL